MQLNDRLLGVAVILGGIAVLSGTLDFRQIPGQQFGSAFFPRLIGVAMIATGLALALIKAEGAWVQFGEMLRGKAGLKVACVFVAVIAWVLISPSLGFLATTALMIALLILLGGGRPIPAALTGFGMALVLHFIFSVLLRVPLPFGVVERLIS